MPNARNAMRPTDWIAARARNDANKSGYTPGDLTGVARAIVALIAVELIALVALVLFLVAR